jgi:imidazolonepropionase-like amidohydrolase
MTLTLIENARIFDGESAEIVPRGAVLVEGETIREWGEGVTTRAEARRIDAGGRFLMPGLIDAHYHANTPSYDFHGTEKMSRSLLAAHAAKLLTGALDRGYTTLRDAAGGDYGLWAAIEQGLIDGPRFFYPGRALTQTGGHADMRRREHVEPCACAGSTVLARPVDGPDQIRHAAREEFRMGAHHIKIFISGGVSTDLAPLDMPHFCDEEIAVAVEEAARRRSYVMAHCHTDEGARRCLTLGVRSIEHGSLIRPDTAAMIAEAGAYVVPTLSAGQLIAEKAEALGLPASAAVKIRRVNEMSLSAVEACARAGVKLGLGCDLHGHEAVATQGRELALRGEVQPAIDVLRSATSINAEILQMKGRLGVIASGALADIILVDGDPLKDLSVFTHSARTVAMVMKGGRVARNRL